MISTPVRVVSAANGIVWVESTARSGCGGCESRSRCGVSGLSRYFSGKRQDIAVRCDAEVRTGDELQLDMDEGDLIKAGLLAYLLPCVLALGGAGTAAALGFGDTGAVLGAGVGLVVGLVFGRLTRWTPRIVVQTKQSHSTEGEAP